MRSEFVKREPGQFDEADKANSRPGKWVYGFSAASIRYHGAKPPDDLAGWQCRVVKRSIELLKALAILPSGVYVTGSGIDFQAGLELASRHLIIFNQEQVYTTGKKKGAWRYVAKPTTLGKAVIAELNAAAEDKSNGTDNSSTGKQS